MIYFISENNSMICYSTTCILYNMNKNLAQKLIQMLKNKKLETLNKNTIIDLIKLHDSFADTSFIDSIEIVINKETTNPIKIEIFNNKMNNIISDISNTRYQEKTTNKNFTTYIYDSHIDIYPNSEHDINTIIKKNKRP